MAEIKKKIVATHWSFGYADVEAYQMLMEKHGDTAAGQTLSRKDESV